MKYYQEKYKEYIESTINSDMTDLLNWFESYIPIGSQRIMDLGFGSGRDSLYFQGKGYDVCSIDPEVAFCCHGKEIGLKDVRNMKAEDICFQEEFDGIWACASLLHIKKEKLFDVFEKCYKALKMDGVMYCSFKYGDFEGVRDERYYVDFKEESFLELISKTRFEIISINITNDVRPERKEKWLNVLLKK